MAVIRTYKNLQDELLALLDESNDTTTTLTLVKNALNAAHVKRLVEEAWPFMLYEPQTLATIAGQRHYTLHTEFFRPLYFKNTSINAFMKQHDEATVLRSGDDWNNDTGSAIDFTLWGKAPVAAQPSAASVLAVSSSSATDNGARTVIIRGDTAQGVRSETITCGSSGTASFTKILRVTKVGTWIGTLTITSNAAAVTILNLFPEEFARSYQQLQTLTIPDAAESIEYAFYRQPFPLVEDNDIPELPPPFEMILVYDAYLTMAAYNQSDAQTLLVVTQKRDELLLALRQSLTEQAQALEAATNYTSYIER